MLSINFFWVFIFLGGVAQSLAALYGFFVGDIDIKFIIPYAVYGAMNLIVGAQGIFN